MIQMRKRGFTIIEVVLVLAIAGLIFLMVFIALPALQRSQRDTQRKDDLARFITAVTTFQSNNRGNLPFTVDMSAPNAYIGYQPGFAMNGQFITRYIDADCEAPALVNTPPNNCGSQFTDPDGTTYSFSPIMDVVAATTTIEGPVVIPAGKFNHVIYVGVGFVCGTQERYGRRGTGVHQLAMFMILEGGEYACVDNH